MHLMIFKLNLNFFCLNLKIHAVKGYYSIKCGFDQVLLD